MIKNILEYISETMAILVAFVFQYPNKRFDKLNCDDFNKSSIFKSETVKVIEKVTTNTGKVKYRGVTWKALLDANDSSYFIERDKEAIVKEIRGNTIIVSNESKKC